MMASHFMNRSYGGAGSHQIEQGNRGTAFGLARGRGERIGA
ncbi:hypothetical protein I546_1073 [Mycobacterium kansasii 732]|uniref:Uncharacterized protein n=1 Tax=Mycobacterium pseudokansasii TaxID=2341080 RepID=A0A498QL77_9MYCO|nr:hypothetical protein I546_1073 [Mycobacterium kansasii 732]VAZ88701.1 hypothetical protein LAUMK35_00640 [Mycobacterium pseudokansasii]VAZ89251.1 hypothetical protein LAUMK21_00638 [Mycobacterium pseudokansasii]VBA46894.1 hypothetical protein LAUMK142_00515 [Mycobacterium pseudokansasii]